MAALDVISIEQAKDWLEIDQSYTLADDKIEAAIKAAISWVERKTDYRLYVRDEVYYSNGFDVDVYSFPINSVIGANRDGCVRASHSIYRGVGAITANVGYNDPNSIPEDLLQACRKLIVYFFENRDMYAAEQFNDVQMLINPYRRSVGIA